MATLDPFLRFFIKEAGAEKANLATFMLSTLPKWEIIPVNMKWQGWDSNPGPWRYISLRKLNKWRWQESNLRPKLYEGSALPLSYTAVNLQI